MSNLTLLEDKEKEDVVQVSTILFVLQDFVQIGDGVDLVLLTKGTDGTKNTTDLLLILLVSEESPKEKLKELLEQLLKEPTLLLDLPDLDG